MPTLTDWTAEPDATWNALIERTLGLDAEPVWTDAARGKALGLLFLNPSLRTRTACEIAAHRLGAVPTVLTPGTGTWGLEWRDGVTMDGEAAEHVREAVGVLSQYVDALGVRAFASGTDYAQDAGEAVFNAIRAAASVPVINLESAFTHPCQALADASVLRARHGGAGDGRRFVLAWATHPKPLPMAVPHSALLMAAREGFDVTVARPEGYDLDPGVMDQARAYAQANGREVSVTDDLDAACDGAHVVYAKAWGGPLAYHEPEREAALRTGPLADWRIRAEHLTGNAAFMHCLPVRRNVVVDDAVLDGPHGLHIRQAGFRLPAHQAILEWIWDLAPFAR